MLRCRRKEMREIKDTVNLVIKSLNYYNTVNLII